jgi:hypothetical protein
MAAVREALARYAAPIGPPSLFLRRGLCDARVTFPWSLRGACPLKPPALHAPLAALAGVRSCRGHSAFGGDSGGCGGSSRELPRLLRNSLHRGMICVRLHRHSTGAGRHKIGKPPRAPSCPSTVRGTCAPATNAGCFVWGRRWHRASSNGAPRPPPRVDTPRYSFHVREAGEAVLDADPASTARVSDLDNR